VWAFAVADAGHCIRPRCPSGLSFALCATAVEADLRATPALSAQLIGVSVCAAVGRDLHSDILNPDANCFTVTRSPLQAGQATHFSLLWILQDAYTLVQHTAMWKQSAAFYNCVKQSPLACVAITAEPSPAAQAATAAWCLPF
jgi:hypothetical protein